MRLRLGVLLGTLCVSAILGAIEVAGWRKADAKAQDWIGFDKNSLHYEVLLPKHYDQHTRYPVVLYLHQLDMGDVPRALLKQVDGWFNTEDFRSRHAAIVVVPMLDQTGDPGGRQINFGGKREGHIGEDNTIAAVTQVLDHFSVDRTRVYVTGNSMGGMGAWQMLLDYNTQTGTKGHIFAAGMPLAGAHRTADPAKSAEALRQVPIWAIHGSQDKEVSLDWDRAMARLLSDSPTFRYTEVAGVGHDVWDGYYPRREVWDWLFSYGGKA